MSEKHVYQAISDVMKDIARDGLGKNQKNTQQGYSFRGIDDVYNALAAKLAHHGLLILPRMLSREVTERTTNKGSAIFSVVVTAEFDFISVKDGSCHTVTMYGEGMDSGDKATNKAMTAAYKYAAFQTFCIPTEARDSEFDTYEVAANEKNKRQKHDAAVSQYRRSINAIKDGINGGDLSEAAEAWFELEDDVKMDLWLAPSKGGCFSTHEREVIKSTEFREAHFGTKS